GSETFAKGRADDDDVIDDNGSRLYANFAGGQVGLNGLIVIELQVYGTVFAEAGNARARLGIQADEPEAWRHIENALILAVGPISQAAPGQLPGSGRTARSFVLSVYPQQFAGGLVKCKRG